MPNQPRQGVKPRSIKVHDDLWHKAQEKAAEKGETVSEAVRKFLERYVR